MADWTLGVLTHIQTLLGVLSMIAAFYYIHRLTKAGKIFPMRKLPGIEAIEEGVDRCAEMGKPALLYVVAGSRGLSDAASGIYALSAILTAGYITELCIKKNVPIFANTDQADMLVLLREQIREKYISAGKPEAFNSDHIVYSVSSQMGNVAQAYEAFDREDPGFVAAIGWLAADCLMIGEACTSRGIFSLSGGAEILQIPYQVLSYDYCMIADEFIAGAAYLSNDPFQIGTIATQDWLKLAAFGLGLIGCLAYTVGSSIILNLLP